MSILYFISHISYPPLGFLVCHERETEHPKAIYCSFASKL
jgi:hypothetical protein